VTTTLTISDALSDFIELSEALDDAYWEAGQIERKDSIYNIITAVNGEIGEINKLSVQDHHYPYEPITQGIQDVKEKLNRLRKSLDELDMRTRTASLLEKVIPVTLSLLK